jgi:NAD(P)-dependent dehydrogenase (short-subunit alcohol dehydrogenase family)
MTMNLSNVREPQDMEFSPEEIEVCLKVLHQIANFPGSLRRDDRFKGLISKIYKQTKRDEQRDERWRQQTEDRAMQATTAMVRIQRDAVSAPAIPAAETSSSRTLNNPETCYICKAAYTEVHFFYHLLCPACAEFNYRMRHLRADLTGRTALVTGGRVKIGFQTVLRLLRDGAKVIVTTRFPNAAARRFHAEPDSNDWANRLLVYGLDLRNIPAVERFAHHLLENEPFLDIIIHNAAQTVRRPHGFYQELAAQEKCPQETLSLEARSLVRQTSQAPLALSGRPGVAQTLVPAVMDILPANALEDNEERADSRTTNSWLLRLDEVSAPEMLEVQLVNSIAPFLLNSRLKPLLVRSPSARRFIVNVSAMEGQFRRHKTVFHPHTNMAKAALNMMTRTSGEDYAKDGIYMNSVDTGWVTDENPTPKRTRIQEDRGFFPPLDIFDGMARIYHPIAQGLNGEEEPLFGLFLKDYAPCPW